MRGITAAAGLAVLLTACAGGTPADIEQFGGEEFRRPCAGITSPAAAEATPPPSFPVHEGWVGTLRATQGKTVILLGQAPADDDIVAVQARQRELLEQAGLTIVSTDREGQAEAEISFDGAREGSVQITPLCRGTVAIRYKLIR